MRRGLTLVELLTGLAVALTVLTAALGLLHQMGLVRRRQEAQEQLGSNAAWLLGTMGRELRQAGLGRPRSARAEPPEEPFPAPFLVGEATQVAFLADVPRPDSHFNGFSSFAASPLPALDSLSLLNELNGGCDVDLSGVACNTATSSHLFTSSPPGSGCRGATDARTCPWALGRYRDGEHLLVVSGSGRWVERRLDSPMEGVELLPLPPRRVLRLTSNIPIDLKEPGPNRAWVSTLDRVFYRLDDGRLQRKQCWGSVGSPIVLTGPGGLAEPCDPAGPDSGTDWETLAQGLAADALDVTYLDAAGNELTRPLPPEALPRVRRVQVRLRLEQSVAGEALTHEDTLTVAPRP